MKIKLFTLPNILTLSNLICGSAALVEILVNQNFVAAFILIIAAAAFDFLDGMSARLLGQYSAIGKELDSLADVVSFGLVPAVAMYSLFQICDKWIDCAMWAEWGAVIAVSIVCCSALRLARFNVSEEEESSFVGLPTPANALFCLSLAMLVECGKVTISAEAVALTSLVMSMLLIAPLKLFALKFKSFAWRENRVRYIFLIIATATLILLREFAIPIIVAIYILASVVDNLSTRESKSKY